MRLQRWPLRIGRPPPAPARRLNDQPVALTHPHRRLPADVDVPRAVVTFNDIPIRLARVLDPCVAAHAAGAAALEAVGGASAALGEDGHLDWFLELDVADNALAAVPVAYAGGPAAQAELVDQDGVSTLQKFNVADTRVGDMGVDAVGAVPPWASARASSDGLGGVARKGIR